ncbi:c-type cytochrome [Novosphingobium sp. SG720]|uniref:c-type cytochrome n=1 Tax=Novosphingobium sp. SG720 TaxID=2586998 RepID=UPI001444D450|nr:c-type cytochrome [Novosphingobium sp. SG720]NKJ42188.1 cytochrome c oxidase cbb3-type subunit 3 [Novosphingobium sp. SG720]
MTAPSSKAAPPRARRLLLILPLVALGTLAIAVAMSHGGKAAGVLRADPETILDDPALRETALKAGKEVFAQHCAACHGENGKGDTRIGASDLTDRDRLYGDGTVSQIEDIARYGIRAGNKRGWNLAVMPAYASPVPDKAEALPPQKPADIEALTQLLLSFTARATDEAAVARGRLVYSKAGCWDCHGRDLGGDPAIGAPNLTDDVWIYGGRADDIRRSISHGRAGTSPAFGRTLTPAQLRSVAVYVASLSRTEQDGK